MEGREAGPQKGRMFVIVALLTHVGQLITCPPYTPTHISLTAAQHVHISAAYKPEAEHVVKGKRQQKCLDLFL